MTDQVSIFPPCPRCGRIDRPSTARPIGTVSSLSKETGKEIKGARTVFKCSACFHTFWLRLDDNDRGEITPAQGDKS
jgi:hypothetical protein